MTGRPHVLIAGAGIGGLTAALALLKAGIEVDVYEQAPALGEIGAGFQVSANGTRVLYHLGLGARIEQVAWQPSGKQIRLWNTGQTWPLFDLGTESVALYGYPYLMFHRADLHRILVDAVRAEKADAIHAGCKCTGFAQDETGVALRIEGGREARGDALIGADGVHSLIRETLFGPDRPVFSGCMAWRGIIAADRLPEGRFRPVGTNWVGPGGHVVHYFVRGGALMNFVGVKERSDWQVESWTAAGSTEECLADFEGWHEDVRLQIRSIDVPYKWALMVREPMDRWTDGRVALLGDACHPMLPFLAQGANMAIEDGFELASCMTAHGDDVPAALRRYEDLRRDRTACAVRGSAANTALFHSPMLADRSRASEFVAENWRPDRIRDRYDWIYTYDATAPATVPLSERSGTVAAEAAAE